MDDALIRLLQERNRGVLATIRRDGRPQMSNIGYSYNGETRTIRASLTDDRAKTRNLRRDPRAAFHVTTDDGWSYVVADGVAELSRVAEDPQDATVDELVEQFRAVAGEHRDWDEYRAAMVAERRLILWLRVDRVYGLAR